MACWQVGKDVGNVKNDWPDLIDTAADTGALRVMKAQSPNVRNIAGKAVEAREKPGTTAEALRFEPVYVDACTLAPTVSMARTMRFKQLGIAKGKQPTGTTVDAVATRYASRPSMCCFGGGRVLAGSGPLWPRSSQSCRWAGLSTCPITPAIRHRGAGCGVAWALRLRGGCCDSRRSLCPRAASASRAQEPGARRALNDEKGLLGVCR
jgi:hypothetical protein